MSGWPHALSGVGIGLRGPHVARVLETAPRVSWFEVVTENYLNAGPAALAALDRIRTDYPVAFHGVALNLGSVDPLDEEYLGALRSLVVHFEPAIVSDHACWTAVGGVSSHDLLPLPYTEGVVRHCADRIRHVQEFLGRRVAIENVSSYLEAPGPEMDEWDFLGALADAADCGILLDVNNVYVSAENHGFDPRAYLAAIPAERVSEIHLAGHERWEGIVVDSHGEAVSSPVLELFGRALDRFGPVPTLLEWDRNLPTLEGLLAERERVLSVLEQATP